MERQAHAETGPGTHTLVRGPPKAVPLPITQHFKEVTGKVTESANETLLYNVGSLSGSSQTQTNVPGTPLAVRRTQPPYFGGTRGVPACAAHPALAEQVQTAALGLGIEGGAHRRPAGADPSGPEPGSEDAQARSPGPQNRCPGSQAAQLSSAQHRVPGAGAQSQLRDSCRKHARRVSKEAGHAASRDANASGSGRGARRTWARRRPGARA